MQYFHFPTLFVAGGCHALSTANESHHEPRDTSVRALSGDKPLSKMYCVEADKALPSIWVGHQMMRVTTWGGTSCFTTSQPTEGFLSCELPNRHI
jgi:hypothetical protein